MRSQTPFIVLGVVAGILLSMGVVLAGNLIPSGGPGDASSQMYTLEQIYGRLATGADGSKATAYTQPSSGPGVGALHSLDEIMSAAPAPDMTNGATADEIVAGTTFWGLRNDGWGVLTGTLTGVAGGVVMPARQDQVKVAAYYNSSIIVPGDALLAPEYIKAGVSLFGVEGGVMATNVYSTFIPKTGALASGDIGGQSFYSYPRTWNTFNLRGKLLDPSGNPLVGMEVRASERGFGGEVVRTDINGNYAFLNLPTQVYLNRNVITGEQWDLQTAWYRISSADADWAGGYLVNTLAVSSTDGVDLLLNATATTTRTLHSITGRVTNGSIGMAGVMIYQEKEFLTPYVQHTAMTDANGYFTMTVLPDPIMTNNQLIATLRPSKSGYVFSPSTLDASATTIPGVPVTITGKNFVGATSATTYEVSGRITTRSHNASGVISIPLAGVTVSDGTRTATTNAAGWYALAGVPVGAYVITPTLAGYFFAPPSIDVIATPATTSPVAGEDSDLQMGESWPGPRFTDNEDGTVTDNLTGLVWLQEGNCFGLMRYSDARNAASALSSGQCGLNGGTDAGQHFAGASTAATATIYGHVADADGAVIYNPLQPEQQVTVTISAGAINTTIDESGYYTLTNVPLGPQTLVASVTGNNESVNGNTAPVQYEFTPISRLALISSSDAVTQNFIGTRIFTVTGRVFNPGALAGVTIRTGDRSATTDANGYYTLTVRAGYQIFTPLKIGYSFTPASQAATISTNKDLSNFAHTTSAATGSFRGYIYDADGHPVKALPLPDATSVVRIFFTNQKADGSTQSSFRTPNDDGLYNWSTNLPIGAVVLLTPTLAYHTFAPPTATIVITGSNVPVPDFVMHPAYDLGGRILDGNSAPLAGATVSNGAQTVTTNAAGYYTFTSQAIGDYVLMPSMAGYLFTPASITTTLSHNSLPGNWRMPNARELHSLVSFGYTSPALPNTVGTGHWSPSDPFIFTGINWTTGDPLSYDLWKWWAATEVPTTNAMTVLFNMGTLHWSDKGNVSALCPTGTSSCHSYIWPVRDVPTP